MSSEGIISRAEKRSVHHSILIDDVLYTWGGNHPDLPAVHDSLWKQEWRSKIKTFHISTGRWTIRPTTGSPPSGVMGYSRSIIDDYKIAFFGGYCGHDSCYYNSLHQLDIKEFNWTQLSHPPDDIMKRAYGGMITIEDDDGIKLLMIGGYGSPPTIPHQQFQYVELPSGRVRTNEINMFTPSSGKWTTPTMIGDVMPPNSGFTINKITKSRAIIFGGVINEGVTTNDMYIMEIINSTVHWQIIKSSQSIGQWPKERCVHASSIISSSVLVVLGGVDQNNQLVNDKCLWLYSINQLSWTKINLPDTVSGRHSHSLSSLMIGPHCVWLVVLGGNLQPEKKTIDGVDKWTADYVSSPNISMIIELMFSDGDWSLGFILDEDNSIHLLELIYKERMKQNPSNDESSLEEDNPLKELNQSFRHDLETSQQTIKSLQEALLDTKEELNKQKELMIEKDSHIAKMTRKVTEGTIVNELEEKVKELTSEVERLREKKQVDDNNPSIDGSTDDITLELEQKNEEISKLTKELESLKKQIEDNKCSINSTQLVHDNESQFTLDDVSKLMVILQPVEDDWYQLGHHLDIEESTLSDVKQLQDSCTVQMEHLLQRWCREGGSLMKLEEALTSMDRTDLISGLHDLKQTSTDDTSSSTDTSVQCDYWNINGLLTVGKKSDLYRADIEHEMTLQECGLKLSIPEGVVTPPESVYEVAAEGLWGGDFIFPEETNLISGVCYISISSLSHLNKPVTVQLEHCANIIHQDQVKYLSFVTANSDRPPYQFQLISGGIFNIHTRHGTISLTSVVTLLAIVVMEGANDDTHHNTDVIPNSYHRIHLYCKDMPPSPKKFKMSLGVTQDLEYCTQVVDKQDSSDLGREESSFRFQFAAGKKRLREDESDEIRRSKSLRLSNLPEIIDGWRITQSSTAISERDINAFTQLNGKLPLIPLTMQPDPSANDFKSTLRYPVTIDGINDGSMDITIDKSGHYKKDHTIMMKRHVGLQFNYMTQSIDSLDYRLDYLSEVHKAGTKLFVVQGDGPQLLNWEEYGLRIGVVKGTLLPSETAEIAVVALVGGQFKFPKGTQLVSAIYAISVSKPLNEPLRVDMQHCVNITRPSQTRNMKFAIAPVNTPSLPYQFEVMEGGEFTVNSFYGSIHRLKFCLLGILAENGSNPGPDDPPVGNGEGQDEEDPSSSSDEETNGHESQNGNTSSDNEEDNGSTSRDDESQTHGTTSGATAVNINSEDEEEEVKSKPVQPPLQESTIDMSDGVTSDELLYAGMLFYEEKRVEDLVTFTAAKQLNALLKYIEKYHRHHAEIGQCIQFSFQSISKYIELKFDDIHQDDPCTGWIIKPQLKPCRLLQKHVDNFGNKQSPIPASCLIYVYSTNGPDTVPVLNYGIPLEGIDPPMTVYIHRALRTSTNIGAPLEAPSSSSVHQSTSLQPSFTLPSSVTKDQLRSVVRQLRQVLDGYQVVLDNLFRQNIQSISRELRQVGILPNDPHQTHSYDAIITCFEIGLSFKRNTRDFEVYCNKFISSLANVGGPCTDAAEMITEDWNASLQQL